MFEEGSEEASSGVEELGEDGSDDEQLASEMHGLDLQRVAAGHGSSFKQPALEDTGQVSGSSSTVAPEYFEARAYGRSTIRFQDPVTKNEHTGSRRLWKESTILFRGQEVGCWLFEDKWRGRSFFTWTLQEEEPATVAGPSQETRNDHTPYRGNGDGSSEVRLPVAVNVYWKRGYVRFRYGDEEFKTAASGWVTEVDGKGTFYTFFDRQKGIRFTADTWITMDEDPADNGGKAAKKEKKEKEKEKEKEKKGKVKEKKRKEKEKKGKGKEKEDEKEKKKEKEKGKETEMDKGKGREGQGEGEGGGREEMNRMPYLLDGFISEILSYTDIETVLVPPAEVTTII